MRQLVTRVGYAHILRKNSFQVLAYLRDIAKIWTMNPQYYENSNEEAKKRLEVRNTQFAKLFGEKSNEKKIYDSC